MLTDCLRFELIPLILMGAFLLSAGGAEAAAVRRGGPPEPPLSCSGARVRSS